MGNCASSSNTNRLNEPERAFSTSTWTLTSSSEHNFRSANHRSGQSLDALGEAEQEWIYTLAEFSNMPDSVKALGMILERAFPLLLEKNRASIVYETLAWTMLQEARAFVHHHHSFEREVTTTGPPPASQRAIQMLPKMTWKRSQTFNNLLCHTCNVCHDIYVDSEQVKRLPCGHIFHASCIDSWLKRHCTCPLCRFQLSTDDLLYNYMQRMHMLSERNNDVSVQTVVQHDDSLGDEL